MKNSDTYQYFDAGKIDRSRPAGRPPKTNRKVELMKKVLKVAQYVAPHWAAGKIWEVFTTPGRTPWSEKQEKLLQEASKVETFENNGTTLYRYRWGTEGEGPKVLLVHGWRSKAVDFRRIIESLRSLGFVVEGLDMRAHGKSGGQHSALPEFYEILNQHYLDWGPYDVVIGYSLGGLASGLVVSKLPEELKPEQVFLIGSPPYAYYFFEDIVKDLGLNRKVLDSFADRVGKRYAHPVKWWDLRDNLEGLATVKLHFLYDEDDETIPFAKGEEIVRLMPKAHFFHTKGLGHYKIITHDAVVKYLAEQTLQPEAV